MRHRTAVYILMIHPVLLGFICALLAYSLHINPLHIMYGATAVIIIGIMGLFYEYVLRGVK